MDFGRYFEQKQWEAGMKMMNSREVDVPYFTNEMIIFRLFQREAFEAKYRSTPDEFLTEMHWDNAENFCVPHCTTGPAIIKSTGEVEFYINGQHLDTYEKIAKAFPKMPCGLLIEISGDDLKKFKQSLAYSFEQEQIATKQKEFEIEI